MTGNEKRNTEREGIKELDSIKENEGTEGRKVLMDCERKIDDGIRT